MHWMFNALTFIFWQTQRLAMQLMGDSEHRQYSDWTAPREHSLVITPVCHGWRTLALERLQRRRQLRLSYSSSHKTWMRGCVFPVHVLLYFSQQGHRTCQWIQDHTKTFLSQWKQNALLWNCNWWSTSITWCITWDFKCLIAQAALISTIQVPVTFTPEYSHTGSTGTLATNGTLYSGSLSIKAWEIHPICNVWYAIWACIFSWRHKVWLPWVPVTCIYRLDCACS